jgi:G3E family GTPase
MHDLCFFQHLRCIAVSHASFIFPRRNDNRQRDSSKPASTADLTDTIELANGCACEYMIWLWALICHACIPLLIVCLPLPHTTAGCSIADELFDSFENLLKVAQRRGITYDRIVLENSGVAEPQNIRDQFNEAIMLGHPLTQRVHLDTFITVVDSATFIHDYSSRAPLAARPELGDGGGMRPVVDLLVEQVECADYVILNKIDLLDQPTTDSLGAIIESLNPLARVLQCAHGIVPVSELLGPASTGLVARLNVEGHHRGAVAAARAAEAGDADEEGDDVNKKEECSAACKNGEHHDHHHHHHDQDHCEECEKEGHAHEHGNEKNGHSHAEHHGHHHQHHKKAKRERQSTTAAARFGIVSFVYARRRPFHPQRLKDLVLRWMPVSHNRALEKGEEAAPANESSPIRTVLRSKGFMWLSNSHTTAFYWSHAGQHFEIRDEGEWWTAVPESDWPVLEAQRETVMADFEGDWGDRRQEIVFIGAGMSTEEICAQLDGALLTDDEMERYKEQYKGQPDPPRPALGTDTA